MNYVYPVSQKIEGKIEGFNNHPAPTLFVKTMVDLIKRPPWARQWNRPISILSGSKRIDSSGVVAVGTTGSHYTATGCDYRFVRADFYYQASNVWDVKLSISSANMAAVITDITDTGCNHLTVAGSDEWVGKKYDPLLLNVGTVATSGTIHWKIYTERI